LISAPNFTNPFLSSSFRLISPLLSFFKKFFIQEKNLSQKLFLSNILLENFQKFFEKFLRGILVEYEENDEDLFRLRRKEIKERRKAKLENKRTRD